MNISQLKNWKQQGEVATLFTVAALVLMAAGTLLGSARVVQDNVLKLGSFAYNNDYRAHFYKGPTFEEKDRIPGQPNSGYTLIRGSLCFTGTTIPSQTQQFWVHTPQDPNQGYPQKACDNTNADTKDDCIVHEGRTVKYIAPQTGRPYCDSPNVGKANWRAWDFTLKLQAPYSKDLCAGLFVSSSSSFVSRDPIEIDMNAWHRYLGQHGVDCGPTPTGPVNPSNTPVPTNQPTNQPSVVPSITNTPTPTPQFRTITVIPDPRITLVPLSPRVTEKPRCPDPKKPCPSITPVGDCRGDMTCSTTKPCPGGYVCLTTLADPLRRGVCQSTNPRCNPSGVPTVRPTSGPTVIPTDGIQAAKIKGDIIVNSCKKPDAVSTIICEKNNPTKCMDVATPVTFVGQDPTNPNKWIYTYEHTQAPSASGSLEPIVKNALYENMQVFAQYTSTGLIREAGRVGFPAAQLGNLRAYATIPSSQTEAIINYEVPQNSIVCPPVTPSAVPPTVIPSPGICKYSAVVEVIDEATGLPVPVSQMGDASKWGLANDKQPNKPNTFFNISGDVVGGERVSKYKFETDRLTFRDGTPPDLNALYTKGAKAQVNLFIDTKKWQITGKIPCQGRGCPSPLEPVAGRNLDQYGSTVDGFNFDCDTNITRYGWKVKQLPPSSPENPGQPGQPAGQCVLRDPVNAVKCSPKNVRANRTSTSTVAVSWTAPDASCNFTAGSNGDFYRIDLIDMTENPRSVITTCDKITKTSTECTLSATYNPNKSSTRGNFKPGHNYVASVYAFKEIPGSTEMCVSNNGNGLFSRDAKDTREDAPEPTTAPIGEGGGAGGGRNEVLTRQLDWMENNVGVCWAGWSHGDCKMDYNGTNEWVKTPNGRFKCLAPYTQNKVTVGVMPGQPPAVLTYKKVDCTGNLSNACIAAKGTNISQCESDLSNATTYNGPATVTLKENECATLDENMGVHPFSCPNEKPGKTSPQPAPRNRVDPQPTARPGEDQPDPQPGTTAAGKGKVTITFDSDKTALPIEESFRVRYYKNADAPASDAIIRNIDFDNGTYEYTIPNFDPEAKAYSIYPYVTYTLEGETQLRRAQTGTKLLFTNEFNKKGSWDMIITLNPDKDEKVDKVEKPEILAGTGRVKVTPKDDIPMRVVAGGIKVVYQSASDNFEAHDAEIHYVDNTSTVTYTIPNFNSKEDYYSYSGYVKYVVEGESEIRQARNGARILRADFNKPGVWDTEVILDPTRDPVVTPGESEEPFIPEIAAGKITIVKKGSIELNETDIVVDYVPNPTITADINLENRDKEFAYRFFNLPSDVNTYDFNFRIAYIASNQLGQRYIHTKTVKLNGVNKADLTKPEKMNFTITLDPAKDRKGGAVGPSSLLSTISLQNNTSSPITSVSIASCDAANKCASNTVSVALAAGANTKFKPTFSVPATTRRLSCIIKFGNGTSKQCTPQLVTGSNGLQFTIAAQANNTVSTTVISPLKTADTNRDCKVTAADATGLRDLDGNGSVNAADTSLFFSYIGQNACN